MALGVAEVIGDVFSDDPQMPVRDARIQPRSGIPGMWVELTAEGFPADADVLIGAGRSASQFRTLNRDRADPYGRIATQVRVPGWVETGDEIVFVAMAEDVEAHTARFRVVDQDEAGVNRRIQVNGRVEGGDPCPRIVTENGRDYALVGEGVSLTLGSWNSVSGYTSALDNCGDVAAVISVTDIRPTEPPERETISVRGYVTDGVECPILRTDDGRTFSLGARGRDIAPGSYVEATGRAGGVSHCLQGEPLDVTSLQPVRQQRETRTPEPRRQQVSGRLIDVYQGCGTLRTRENEIVKLADMDDRSLVGKHVTAVGTASQTGRCGNEQTLDVSDIRAETRNRQQQQDRQQGGRLTARNLVGTWRARGGDCANPDFEVQRTMSGRYAVAATVNEKPQRGFVRAGDSPAMVFSAINSPIPVDKLGEDRLAIYSPIADGAVRIGGTYVPRSGTIFTACSPG